MLSRALVRLSIINGCDISIPQGLPYDLIVIIKWWRTVSYLKIENYVRDRSLEEKIIRAKDHYK
jgi:hypothetical protein